MPKQQLEQHDSDEYDSSSEEESSSDDEIQIPRSKLAKNKLGQKQNSKNFYKGGQMIDPDEDGDVEQGRGNPYQNNPQYASQADFDDMGNCCCTCTNGTDCLPPNTCSNIKDTSINFLSKIAPILPGVGDDEIIEEKGKKGNKIQNPDSVFPNQNHNNQSHISERSNCWQVFNCLSCGKLARNPNFVKDGKNKSKIITLFYNLRIRIFPQRIYAYLVLLLIGMIIGFATAGCTQTWGCVLGCSWCCSNSASDSGDIHSRYIYPPTGCMDNTDYKYDKNGEKYYMESRYDFRTNRDIEKRVNVQKLGTNVNYIDPRLHKQYEKFAADRKKLNGCSFPLCCYSHCRDDGSSPSAFKDELENGELKYLNNMDGYEETLAARGPRSGNTISNRTTNTASNPHTNNEYFDDDDIYSNSSSCCMCKKDCCKSFIEILFLLKR